MGKRKVVLITDGDSVARKSIEKIAKKVGGRCISLSGGNPTPYTGEEIVQYVLQAAYDPVLVMVDDKGVSSCGKGEEALIYIAKHPRIQVLGVVAVASNTYDAQGTLVDFSVTKDGEIIDAPVDKYGNPCPYNTALIGDTVDVLNELNIPVIVGVGDIGKQDGFDAADKKIPVTTEAVKEILRRSGYMDGSR